MADSATKADIAEDVLQTVLPLNNVVGLPGEDLTFSLSNPDLIAVVQRAQVEESRLFTVLQRYLKVKEGVSVFGVMAKVAEVFPAEKGKVRFRLTFDERCEAVNLEKNGKTWMAKTRCVARKAPSASEQQAVKQEAEKLVKDLTALLGGEAVDLDLSPSGLDLFFKNASRLYEFTLEDRVACLQDWSHKKRMRLALELLAKYLEIHSFRNQLRQRTGERLRRMEREVFLNEEKKIIDSELGRSGQRPCPPEFQNLKEAIQKFVGPDEAREVLDREFERLLRTGPNSPHASTIQDYLETLLDLPWGLEVEPCGDWDLVETTLSESHYGLHNVKDRLLRYLSVVSLTGQQPGMILCLVGPPGVGKTSFARAIAEALQLPFVKKSLGGVRDESEIRGHRRTYIGSMPGRIVQGLRKARCSNPVFLLDEVDKLGNDHRGDPASALLEVLDTEENQRFSDHYLELEIDLSKVFWILTANNESQIPSPLLDRLEIVRFAGYTETEKIHIAQDYLSKRCMARQGLEQHQLRLSQDVTRRIIRQYTREAGVRELQRRMSNLVQHLALQKVRGQRKRPWTIGVRSLKEALGPAQHEKPRWTKRTWVPGIMAGLAWTSYGGTVLRMECSTVPGKGELKLTGKLGEVMKESAHTALSFLKHHTKRLNLDGELWKNVDFHIHIPAGAVPKEGPSAGMGLALLIYSALSGRRCQPFWAMTGEITLHGHVLAIGGVKEKLLAAGQEGFEGVLLPAPNRPDVEDIKVDELDQLEIRYVKSFWDAFQFLFEDVR